MYIGVDIDMQNCRSAYEPFDLEKYKEMFMSLNFDCKIIKWDNICGYKLVIKEKTKL